MWALRRGSRTTLAALALALWLAAGAAHAAPARVVSVNLCTDQLAMLLAAPGQLVAVSHLAADPRASAMAAAAAGLPATRGGAEEVFALAPDLVLAGTFTTRATVDLLRRLGVPVVELPPATRLDDVADHLMAVGRALGAEGRAAALAAAYAADLAALRAAAAAAPPATAALWQANGYTAGAGTLADDILAAAGLVNIAPAAGLAGGGFLPLERLVAAAPDVVVTAPPYPGRSRAEDLMAHPAVRALIARAGYAPLSDAGWVCGIPAVLDAVRQMAAAR